METPQPSFVSPERAVRRMLSDPALKADVPIINVRPQILARSKFGRFKDSKHKGKIRVNKEVITILKAVSAELDTAQRQYLAFKQYGSAAQRHWGHFPLLARLRGRSADPNKAKKQQAVAYGSDAPAVGVSKGSFQADEPADDWDVEPDSPSANWMEVMKKKKRAKEEEAAHMISVKHAVLVIQRGWRAYRRRKASRALAMMMLRAKVRRAHRAAYVSNLLRRSTQSCSGASTSPGAVADDGEALELSLQEEEELGRALQVVLENGTLNLADVAELDLAELLAKVHSPHLAGAESSMRDEQKEEQEEEEEAATTTWKMLSKPLMPGKHPLGLKVDVEFAGSTWQGGLRTPGSISGRLTSTAGAAGVQHRHSSHGSGSPKSGVVPGSPKLGGSPRSPKRQGSVRSHVRLSRGVSIVLAQAENAGVRYGGGRSPSHLLALVPKAGKQAVTRALRKSVEDGREAARMAAEAPGSAYPPPVDETANLHDWTVQGGARPSQVQQVQHNVKLQALPPPVINEQQMLTRHQQAPEQHQQQVKMAGVNHDELAGIPWAQQLRRKTAPDPDMSLLAMHAKALAMAGTGAASPHNAPPSGRWHNRFSAGGTVYSGLHQQTMSVSQQQLPQLAALRVAVPATPANNAGFSGSSSSHHHHHVSSKLPKPAVISRSAEFDGPLLGKLPVLGHLSCKDKPANDVFPPAAGVRRPRSS
eukprot:gene7232-7445_t